MATNLPTKRYDLSHIPTNKLQKFGRDVVSLLNIAGVNTSRATHYATKEEKEIAEKKIHFDVFSKDRGVYAAAHCMAGVTDYSIQRAVTAMLANPWHKQKNSALTPSQEMQIIQKLVHNLPPNRMLNLFCELREQRVNNTRTKKRVILPALLGSENLDWWAVKYRNKMRKSLEHAWGKRRTGIIKSILSNGNTPNQMELDFIEEHIVKYVHGPATEALEFILNVDMIYQQPLFKAFHDARTDIEKGKDLPLEVLEGIRSTYHKEFSQKDLLELVKNKVTTKQRRLVQRKAKKEGVNIKFDPNTASPVELYIYAFEMGMTNEIRSVLIRKAKQIAESIPYSFEKIGILVDDSFSMSGSITQKLRPMAITYAMRDVLTKLGDSFTIEYVTGSRSLFHKPHGGTNLAMGIVKLLNKGVDTIFIISDGYENQPSGRVSEVLTAMKNIGVTVPIQHINPVIATETGKGLRHISNEIPMLPISNPAAFGMSMLIPMLTADPLQGITGLLNHTTKLLEG